LILFHRVLPLQIHPNLHHLLRPLLIKSCGSD
jgi:hypothetical protein